MDVAPEFLSFMQSIEPENMHLMKMKELIAYGIGPGNVVYDERVTADEAAKYGISSAEYRERRQRAQAAAAGKSDECKNVDAIPTDDDRESAEKFHVTLEQQMKVDCALAIQYGISIELYQKRSRDVNALCKKFTDQEQNNACDDRYMTTGHPIP